MSIDLSDGPQLVFGDKLAALVAMANVVVAHAADCICHCPADRGARTTLDEVADIRDRLVDLVARLRQTPGPW